MGSVVGLSCLWYRKSLEPFADGALSARAARRVGRHVDGCATCAAQVSQTRRIRALLAAAVPADDPREWTSFWAGIQVKIAQAPSKPIPSARDSWWLPLWWPFWGHPRLALSGALAGVLALTLSLWPVDDDGSRNAAWAESVEVQDVSTPDPEHTVMVFSSSDRTLTVIWLFTPEGTPAPENVSR